MTNKLKYICLCASTALLTNNPPYIFSKLDNFNTNTVCVFYYIKIFLKIMTDSANTSKSLDNEQIENNQEKGLRGCNNVTYYYSTNKFLFY